jgi:alkylhydroperoxidase family enzyme
VATLLHEIAWGDPLLPVVPDAQWEATIRGRGAPLGQAERRVSPNRWVRELSLWVLTYRARDVPERLSAMGGMVCAQEAACRYCYGALRASMKLLGYTEAQIARVEGDVRAAELDPRERAYVQFCRSLARARPRPGRAELDSLTAVGYGDSAVAEIVFLTALSCYHNRLTVLIACPPEQTFERVAASPVGRLVGLLEPLLRGRMRRRLLAQLPAAPPCEALRAGAFGQIVSALAGVPAAAVMKEAIDGAMASPVLSLRVKALMFAVVARTLDCRHTEAGARELLRAGGLDDAQTDQALATLHCDSLAANESMLLDWVRGTVRYETVPVQEATRALGARIGEAALLEAVGVAALANATVRVATLLER